MLVGEIFDSNLYMLLKIKVYAGYSMITLIIWMFEELIYVCLKLVGSYGDVKIFLDLEYFH